MMKKLLCAFAALMIAADAQQRAALSESLFVDNRETDKIYPERLNLRAQPTRKTARFSDCITRVRRLTVLAADSDGIRPRSRWAARPATWPPHT